MKLKLLRVRGASKELRWAALAAVLALVAVLSFVNYAQGPAPTAQIPADDQSSPPSAGGPEADPDPGPTPGPHPKPPASGAP
mgnify:CR=1 FL=1